MSAVKICPMPPAMISSLGISLSMAFILIDGFPVLARCHFEIQNESYHFPMEGHCKVYLYNPSFLVNCDRGIFDTIYLGFAPALNARVP